MAINWPWSKPKYIVVPCENGRKVFVYDIDYIAPIVTKRSEKTVSGKISIPEVTSAEFAQNDVSDAKDLLVLISEENDRLIFAIRSAYSSYMNEPCEDKGFYRKQVEIINSKMHEFAEAKLKIKAFILISSTIEQNEIALRYQELLNSINFDAMKSSRAVLPSIQAEMKENEKESLLWRENTKLIEESERNG
jgi:hypothetical protein